MIVLVSAPPETIYAYVNQMEYNLLTVSSTKHL